MRQIYNALYELINVTHSQGINWAVMGELSLYLNDIEVVPDKIEIFTDETGAYLLDKELGKKKFRVIERLSIRKNKNMMAHSGSYIIHGIRVNIIADIIFRLGEYINKLMFKKILPYCGFKVINSYEILITPLEFELVRYLFMGINKDLVPKILDRIKVVGLNEELLELLLEGVPNEKRNEVLNIIESKNIILQR